MARLTWGVCSCLLLLLLLLLSDSCHGDALPELSLPPIRIGSFNIQVFGVTKMSKPEVVEILLKTLQRYDLVFIMEIRDKSGEAIQSLLRQLNERVEQPQKKFRMALSERLGRTSAKEQYAYLYRESKFRLLDTFQYQDVGDVFERPPYGVQLEVTGAEQLQRIGLLGIHVSPRDALTELRQLHRVQTDLKQRWNNNNLLIVGDFNADCSYLNRYDRVELPLWLDSSLSWLIGACHETTMVHTSCLYDRIIASGQAMQKSLIPASSQVFYFDKEFHLNRTMAGEVSDHYPVEVLLAGEIVNDRIRQLVARQSIEVSQEATDEQAALLLCEAAERPAEESGGFQLDCLHAGHSKRPHSAVARRWNVEDAGSAVQQLRAAFPNVLHSHTASMARHLQLQRLPQASVVDVEVACEYRQSPIICTVRITVDDDNKTGE